MTAAEIITSVNNFITSNTALAAGMSASVVIGLCVYLARRFAKFGR